VIANNNNNNNNNTLKVWKGSNTNQNSIQEEIKNRLKSGSACYQSVQSLVLFNLLSKYSYIKVKIYINIILPFLLCGCETWSLILREERRMMVFRNRVLRRIFGPKKDKLRGEWRKLHIEELNDLYSSPNIVRVIKSRSMRWAGHVARVGERKGVHRVLMGKPEGKRALGSPSVDWRIILRRIFRKWDGGMDWMDLAQDRDRWWALVNAVTNQRVL